MSLHIKEIDLHRFATAHGTGACVIDVREPYEYTAGHVPGAMHIPMGQVAARLGELDRAVPVYVICATGNRSTTVTNFLVRAGFEAYSVAGGTKGWARLGRPIHRGSSSVTR
jgi:rhodanese-related sulfurtransferase